MFRKLVTVTLALLAPLIAAEVTLNPPQGTWYSQREVTITWNSQPSDPLFSIYLINSEFHDSFAIANNVRPTDNSITLTLPVLVPRNGYTLRAVNVGNVNDVYSETGVFSIAPNPDSTTTSGTSTGITTRTTGTSTSFGTTITSPVTTGPTTRPLTSSTAGPTTTQGTFNGAGTFKMNSHVTAFAAVAFSVVAGATVFAL